MSAEITNVEVIAETTQSQQAIILTLEPIPSEEEQDELFECNDSIILLF